ncbi:MAG: hypothetical protein COA63_000215 [Methylophaga sp.]|nr:hypothetical protein [Methylophaga sp.]
MKNIILSLCILFLTACAASSAHQPIEPIRKLDDIKRLTDYVSTPFIGEPSPENYSICHNNGCAEFSFISLTSQQWPSVEALFLPIASNAQQEREQIKSAIALLEFYSGAQSTTYKDQAENSLAVGREGQLDCIDEATNSTVYLRMIANAGLLKFHQQSSRTSRGGFIIPHNTATIIEIESKQRYAVDSWFEANGEPPHIVTLKAWKKGWKPEND